MKKPNRGKPKYEITFETWRLKKPRLVERRLLFYSREELRAAAGVLVDVLGGCPESNSTPGSKFDDGLDVTARRLK